MAAIPFKYQAYHEDSFYQIGLPASIFLSHLEGWILLTNLIPEIPGAYFINLGRMKG